MPKVVRTRQSRTTLHASAQNSTEDISAAVMSKPTRTALGDVSNRRSTRLSKNHEGEPHNGLIQKRTTRATRARSRAIRELSAGEKSVGTVKDNKNVQNSNLPEERRRSLRLASATVEVNSTGESSRGISVGASKRKIKGATRASSRARGRDNKRVNGNEAAVDVKSKKARCGPKAKVSKPVATKQPSKNGPSIRARKRSRSAPRGSGKATSCDDETRYPGGTARRGRSRTRSLCSDFLSKTDYKLVRKPFDDSKYTAGIASHDHENRDDVLEVSNYATDIFQRLYHAETKTRPLLYMESQRDINARMRAILVDWLVEVHMKFRLVPETLYLCVNIIDRYCSLAPVQRSRLQLVGVTALLIACKYEEIYPPEVRDCVYITDRAYSRQEVLDMEQDIVQRLEFKLTVPTAYPFLQRFLFITNAREMTRIASNYYMERTLQEHDVLRYRPSLLAAAAVCLALNNPDIRARDELPATRPGVPSVLIEYTGFSHEDITDCTSLISRKVGEEITTASRRQLVAVKRKYDSRKHHHVSTEVLEPDSRDLDN